MTYLDKRSRSLDQISFLVFQKISIFSKFAEQRVFITDLVEIQMFYESHFARRSFFTHAPCAQWANSMKMNNTKDFLSYKILQWKIKCWCQECEPKSASLSSLFKVRSHSQNFFPFVTKSFCFERNENIVKSTKGTLNCQKSRCKVTPSLGHGLKRVMRYKMGRSSGLSIKFYAKSGFRDIFLLFANPWEILHWE